MIIDLSQLSDLRTQHQDEAIVLGSSVFDLLHIGHISYLQKLKEHGDIVVVLVKPDTRIKQFLTRSTYLARPEEHKILAKKCINNVRCLAQIIILVPRERIELSLL